MARRSARLPRQWRCRSGFAAELGARRQEQLQIGFNSRVIREIRGPAPLCLRIAGIGQLASHRRGEAGAVANAHEPTELAIFEDFRGAVGTISADDLQ